MVKDGSRKQRVGFLCNNFFPTSVRSSFRVPCVITKRKRHGTHKEQKMKEQEERLRMEKEWNEVKMENERKAEMKKSHEPADPKSRSK
jgi:hypothetical protein